MVHRRRSLGSTERPHLLRKKNQKKTKKTKQNKNKTTQISLLGLYAKRLQTGSCNKSPNTIQPMLPSPRPLTPKRQKLQEHGPFKTLAL